ncbi:MAG: protein-L-isoaspartate(D-aspartate) O-methyltransferase [Deferrisomatales bacterium]
MSLPAPETWARLRDQMVRAQIEARGVRDPRLLAALGRVPRHEFVPEASRHLAYDDTPLPIGRGQTVSQPYMVALMTEALGVGPGDRVLEVGTGAGYQAAVLAELGCRVFTIERDPVLAREAGERLARLGYGAVDVREGDGTLGLPREAPFRGIVVTAGGPRVPEALKAQLEDGGVLVIPVGDRGSQALLRLIRQGDRFATEDLGGCRFVPLVGEEGW